MLKAVLFDLDDTLRDFMHTKRKSCGAAITAMMGAGLKIDYEEAEKILFDLYKVHGIEDREIFQKFLAKVAGKVDDRLLAEAIVAYREAQLPNIKPYSNVRHTLEELRAKGLRLGILSDAPKLKMWMRLVEIRLADLFDSVVGFEDTGKRKPSPEPFLLSLKNLGVKPEECLYVGDWPERDVVGGKAVGMKTALAVYSEVANSGHFEGTKNKLEKGGLAPDYVLKDIKDLLEIVEKESR